MGRTEEAFPYLDEARRSGKYAALSSQAMALALERQDRYLEALAFVENALRAKPDYPEPRHFKLYY
jgi:tetratricopeptide (TPR) repeat protein